MAAASHAKTCAKAKDHRNVAAAAAVGSLLREGESAEGPGLFTPARFPRPSQGPASRLEGLSLACSQHGGFEKKVFF